MSTEHSSADSAGSRIAKIFRFLWLEYSVLFALILLMIIATILNPRFLILQNLINILRQVSVIGIVAMGMTVIIISGGFDLSVGSVLALAGVAGMSAMNASGSIPTGILATVAVALTSGAIIGGLVTKGKIAPFIATVGMMAVARSLAMFFVRGGNVVGQVDGYTMISRGELFGLRYPIYTFVIVTIVVHVILSKTRFGRYVYAIGSNEKAALLSAINVDRIKTGVYMLGGALVAVASIMESATLNSISSANSGNLYELDAIATCVIGGSVLGGGRGRAFGTFLGVVLLGVLNNLLNLMNVSPFLQGFVKGLIVIVAVLVQRKRA
jgi:ribose transport system permease protein